MGAHYQHMFQAWLHTYTRQHILIHHTSSGFSIVGGTELSDFEVFAGKAFLGGGPNRKDRGSLGAARST